MGQLESEAAAAANARGTVPLVVDLDQALVPADLLLESLLLLAKRSPRRLPAVLALLRDGPARFKHALAAEAVPDAETLPCDPALLAFLHAQKAAGRRLVLLTSADAALADAVAARTALFDEVIASDAAAGPKGACKRDLVVARFGADGFDYVGDDGREPAVTAAARRTLSPLRAGNLRAGRGPGVYLAALRPGQWLKNLLVFLPMLAAAEPVAGSELTKGLLAVIAFSFCASSGYIANDLMDIPADRHHPAKRHRPIASGQVSLRVMLALVPLLLLAGLTVAAMLPAPFAVVLASYCVLTLAYSLRLKDIAVLDVLALSLLYTLRVIGGVAAFELAGSVWLLAFCIFLFLSLGLVKRYDELVIMRKLDGAGAHARAYRLKDRELLAAIGVASGYVAALLLVLDQTREAELADTPELDLAGWAICLLFLYWISHIWLVAHRGRMEDDPFRFALRDRVSRIVLALALAAYFVRWLA